MLSAVDVASPSGGEHRAGGVSEDEVRASASGSCAHCYEGPCVSFHLTTLELVAARCTSAAEAPNAFSLTPPV